MSSDIVQVHEVVDPTTLLSPSELAFFGFLNRARTQPAEFARELEALGQYYEGTSFKYPGEVTLITKEGKAAFDEALAFLQSAKPVRQLALSAGLTAASQDHVGDHFTKNLVGTTGSDGADSLSRANRYGEWSLLCGESIGYGEADPFRALAALIIDDGLATRSHRGMIFTDDFELVGLASGAHKKFGNQWVILFARSFVEDAAKFSARSPKLRKAYAQARSKGFDKNNQSLTVSKVRVQKEGSGGGGGRCLIL